MVNIFEHFVAFVQNLIYHLSFLKVQVQVSLDLTKIALPYEGGLLPSNYWHSEENQFSIN